MGFIISYDATINRFILELGENLRLAEIDRNLLQKVNSEYDLFLYYVYNDIEDPGLATWLILLDLLKVDPSDSDWDLTWEELKTMFVPSSLGESNTSSNLGSGEGLFTTKSGVNLPFKSLIAGTNVSFDPTSTDITINVSGGLNNIEDISGVSPISPIISSDIVSKIFLLTPTEITSINKVSGIVAGQSVSFEIRQGVTGYAVTFGTGYLNGTDSLIDVSASANAYTLVMGYIDSNLNIVIVSVKDIT